MGARKLPTNTLGVTIGDVNFPVLTSAVAFIAKMMYSQWKRTELNDVNMGPPTVWRQTVRLSRDVHLTVRNTQLEGLSVWHSSSWDV